MVLERSSRYMARVVLYRADRKVSLSAHTEKLEPKCSLTGSGASIMSVQFDHHVSQCSRSPLP